MVGVAVSFLIGLCLLAIVLIFVWWIIGLIPGLPPNVKTLICIIIGLVFFLMILQHVGFVGGRFW